jgi:hypothetical protein
MSKKYIKVTTLYMYSGEVASRRIQEPTMPQGKLLVTISQTLFPTATSKRNPENFAF